MPDEIFSSRQSCPKRLIPGVTERRKLASLHVSRYEVRGEILKLVSGLRSDRLLEVVVVEEWLQLSAYFA